jgi:hypothetical protein
MRLEALNKRKPKTTSEEMDRFFRARTKIEKYFKEEERIFDEIVVMYERIVNKFEVKQLSEKFKVLLYSVLKS